MNDKISLQIEGIVDSSTELNDISSRLTEICDDMYTKINCLREEEKFVTQVASSNYFSSIDALNNEVPKFSEAILRFSKFLSDRVLTSYGAVDTDIKTKIESNLSDSLDKLATLGVIASTGVDFGKIASTAQGALHGNFIHSDKIYKEAFESNELEFITKDDGSVLITRGGTPIGFTTQDGINQLLKDDNITSINDDSDSPSRQLGSKMHSGGAGGKRSFSAPRNLSLGDSDYSGGTGTDRFNPGPMSNEDGILMTSIEGHKLSPELEGFHGNFPLSNNTNSEEVVSSYSGGTGTDRFNPGSMSNEDGIPMTSIEGHKLSPGLEGFHGNFPLSNNTSSEEVVSSYSGGTGTDRFNPGSMSNEDGIPMTSIEGHKLSPGLEGLHGNFPLPENVTEFGGAELSRSNLDSDFIIPFPTSYKDSQADYGVVSNAISDMSFSEHSLANSQIESISPKNSFRRDFPK